MAPVPNRVKVRKYVYGLTIETNNFTFNITLIILGLESTCPNNKGAKIGLYGPMTSRVEDIKGLNGPF